MKSRILSAAAILLVMLAASAAYADLSKKVIAEFKGQIVVSDEPVEPGSDDKSTIAAFKKARL
jgi:hypothetical protein